MYIERYLDSTILRTSHSFKVLYLGGPRQVGKTTLLSRLCKQEKMATVSLDDPEQRRIAREDPGFFLQQHPAPVFIDEAQYAPQLFPYIKMRVDAQQKNGMYWLSGSQHFSMIRELQESLAGRVGIISMLGLSLSEEQGMRDSGEPFSPSRDIRSCPFSLSFDDLFVSMHRGSFPALVSQETVERERFYASYIQTYLDRDVTGLFGVQKIEPFHRLLTLVAAHTAQVLNMSSLAQDASLPVSTVRSWLSILEATGLVFFLRPYASHLTKRMTRAPKMYLLDTGLVSYLTKWSSPETLMSGAMAGAVFETFVVSEILKSYLHRGKEAPIFYYRDKEKREIDVLLEKDKVLYPLEIMMASRIRNEDLKHIVYLRSRQPRIGSAVVVCAVESPRLLDRDTVLLPVSCIV